MSKDNVRYYTDDELYLRRKGLIELTEILEKAGVPYYLGYGVLLGAIREKNFIRWDPSVELFVKSEDIVDKTHELFILIQEAGFEEISFDGTTEVKFKYIMYKYGQRYVIVSWWIKDSFRRRLDLRLPARFFENTIEIEFLGKYYPCMTPPEEYLEYTYIDWKTPMIEFDDLKTANPESYIYPKWLRVIKKKRMINIINTPITKLRKMIKTKMAKCVNKLINIPKNKKQEAMMYIFPALKTWGLTNGDYLEFGVYRGRAFIEAFKQANSSDIKDMRFIAFDSFEGLPEVEGKDAECERFTRGQYACSEKEFTDIINEAGVDMNRVLTVPGFFDRSLTRELKNELGIKRAAVIWIDCDIYESTIPVLNFITDIITSGTFIAFDDWFSFGADPYAGEIRATREWLERNKDITLEHYRDFGTSGRIFLVQKW